MGEWVEAHRADIEAFQEGINQLADDAKNSTNYLDSDSAWLVERGWGLLPHVPVTFASNIKKHVSELPAVEQTEALNTLMLNVITPEELRGSISTGWKESTSRPERQAIFEKIVDAYEAGHYHVALSACMPHFEGLLVDYLKATGYLKPDKYVRFDKVCKGTGQLPRDNMFPLYGEAVRDMVLTRVFASFKVFDASVDPLNRHAMLHGMDTSPVTQERSLQALISLETLRFSLNMLHEQSVPASVL